MKKIVFVVILLLTASLSAFGQTKVEKDVDNTKDPVTSLREQIEGATIVAINKPQMNADERGSEFVLIPDPRLSAFICGYYSVLGRM